MQLDQLVQPHSPKLELPRQVLVYLKFLIQESQLHALANAVHLLMDKNHLVKKLKRTDNLIFVEAFVYQNQYVTKISRMLQKNLKELHLRARFALQ